MSSTDPDAAPEWVRTLVNHWNGGSLTPLLELLADDIVIDAPRTKTNPARQVILSGKTELLDRFGALKTSRPRFTLLSALAGDVAASLVLEDDVGDRLTVLLELNEDRKIRRITSYRPMPSAGSGRERP